ncbi:cytochrome P450 [Sphingomonas sp. MG17]|uniref:Cytochrome P450 n=1 Tax=Sphingomonas tagetis TaxID=2949092 RepID=A0A9X2KLB6_9SPHN|nr:cytochrome P450 [Sphingomonas tagetis]MCP3731379.1 cytochrome P450 [Sphingomonas tagetis]
MTGAARMEAKVPASDLDFWSDEVIADPYPHYRTLRDIGPVVWLSRYDSWAIVHHKPARDALLNAEVFTSTAGIAMNAEANRNSEGVMIFSDDPDHQRLRRVFNRPLLPGALARLKDRLSALAEARVGELIEQGEFDAVTQLAHYLPLTVVTELLGLTEQGKRNMLGWAAGLFDALGPAGNARTDSGIAIAVEAFTYLHGLKREELDPDGWAAGLFRAADAGEISQDEARTMLMDYTGPALDTTINGLSSALWLFANHPDQWDLLREKPELANRAIDEALRIESPIRAFARLLTRDHEMGGVTLRKGDRALIVYASANRDERRYPEPDRFDITRDARDHVAFGYGMHLCAGMHLAKLEIATVLNILVRRVARFHLVEARRELHNTLRGLSKLVLKVDVV